MLRNLLEKLNVDNNKPQPEKPQNENEDEESEGFICPVCMASLATPEQLQRHYQLDHADSASSSANRNGDVLALRQELDDLRTSLKEEKWYSTELRKEVDRLQVGFSEKTEKKVEDFHEFDLMKQEIHASEEGRQRLSSEIVQLRKQYADLIERNQGTKEGRENASGDSAIVEEENEQLRAHVVELESERSALGEEITQLKLNLLHADVEGRLRQISDLNAQVEHLKTQIKHKEEVFDKQLVQKETLQRELQKKIEILQKEIAEPCRQCQNYEQQLVKLQQNFKESVAACTNYERELKDVRLKIKDVEEKKTYAEKHSDSLKREIEALMTETERMNAKIVALSESLTVEVNAVKSAKEQQIRTESEKVALESRIVELERKLANANIELETLRLADSKYNSDLVEEKLHSQSVESDLEQSRSETERLKKQKSEMQILVRDLQIELEKTKLSLDEERSESKKSVEKLTMDIKNLRSDLAASELKIEDSKRDAVSAEAQRTSQIEALTHNLSTLRSELLQSQDEVQKVNQQMMDVAGQKLELEAKLENNNDERRVLLERCLNSEVVCDKLREDNAELRRKLKDTEAALQEMGRENQSLQITQNKVKDRTWFDDREVTTCMGCQKTFSITNRRHHCRNCGKIYCHDCSSRQAPLASSKNPVRVCEQCFTEINQHRSASITVRGASDGR